MSISGYLAILQQRKLTVIFTAMIVTFIAFLGAILSKPVYQATAKVQVSTAPRGSLDFIDYNLDYTDRLMNTYLHIAKSGPYSDLKFYSCSHRLVNGALPVVEIKSK